MRQGLLGEVLLVSLVSSGNLSLPSTLKAKVLQGKALPLVLG